MNVSFGVRESSLPAVANPRPPEGLPPRYPFPSVPTRRRVSLVDRVQGGGPLGERTAPLNAESRLPSPPCHVEALLVDSSDDHPW